MSIEWNKVTWYSKLAAGLTVVIVFALGFYLGAQFNAPVDQQSNSSATSSTGTNVSPTKSPASTPTTVKKVSTVSKYAAVVSMTSAGFVPKNVQIKPGQTVHFVNSSNASMRIYSNSYQPNQPYNAVIDELHSVGKNGTFDFLFNNAGVWTYYNLNGDPQMTGTVTVQ